MASGKHGRRASDEVSFLDEQEACKSVFVPWTWLTGSIIALVSVGTIAGWKGKAMIDDIDHGNVQEIVLRTQADSSLSWRISRLEKVQSDLDTIKTILRSRK